MSKIPDGWIKQPDGSYSQPKRERVAVSGKAFDSMTTLAPVIRTLCGPEAQKIDAICDAACFATRSFTIKVVPCPAPRMTRRDKWLTPRRPAVQRYFDFRDALRAAVGEIKEVPDRVDCEFYFAMPDSWSEKKKIEMDGKPHRSKPDRDNCDKAVCDALFAEDSAIHEGSQKKRWCRAGQERVEIKLTNYPKSC